MSELRTIRKKIGITQEEAAKMVGVSRRTYQTYEEKEIINKAYDEIYAALKDMEGFNFKDYVLNHKIIKKRCEKVFVNNPEVECAYLYGSYARGEADEESDVDILVVLKEAMGLRYYGMAGDLERALGKRVDLQTIDQVCDSVKFMKRFLKDCVKIYG